jgi:hypothetical protein
MAFCFFLLLRLFSRYYLDSPSIQLIAVRFIIIIEFTFLCIFYYYILHNKNKKTVSAFSISVFLFYSIYDYYTTKGSDFTYIPLVIECLFFLFVIPYYFYEKMQYSVTSPIYQSPDFWISVAFLIYFSGNFFLFLFSKTMFKDSNSKIQYNLIYCCFTILKDILLCTAIFVNNRHNKKIEKSNIPISINLDIFNPIKNKY